MFYRNSKSRAIELPTAIEYAQFADNVDVVVAQGTMGLSQHGTTSVIRNSELIGYDDVLELKIHNPLLTEHAYVIARSNTDKHGTRSSELYISDEGVPKYTRMLGVYRRKDKILGIKSISDGEMNNDHVQQEPGFVRTAPSQGRRTLKSHQRVYLAGDCLSHSSFPSERRQSASATLGYMSCLAERLILDENLS